MTDTIESTGPFVYQAQTVEGQSITGTIDARDVEQAQRLLAGLRLRVLEISRDEKRTPTAGKAMRADDFIAFNQQLAHLTSAGMPVEQGLRLIAQDMKSGLLASTVRDLAAELERGTPMEQAFDKYRDRFPPLYSKLIGAGVSSGNLPGMLLNLGRHMELVQRLRAALWRAAAYPLMVMACVVLVVSFVAIYVIPRFQDVFKGFGTRLPLLTQAIMTLPMIMPWVLLAIAVILIAALVTWISLKSTGRDRVALEPIALRLPLVGPILRYNLLARWSDAVSIGVHGGLDLPRAIELANAAVASPALSADGRKIVDALQAGKPLEEVHKTRLLPATVVASISLASKQNDLPAALLSLSEMYQQQAQLRVALLPGILTPILLIFIACIIGVIILGLFLPLVSLIQNITG